MNIIGISAGSHDAAVAIVNSVGDIEFAAHSERYSKVKNDLNLDSYLLDESFAYAPQHIAYYERPIWHNVQRLYSGQRPLESWFLKFTLQKHLGNHYHPLSRSCYPHHLSHAALAFQTSPFDRATAVTIDAVGELDTATIWQCWYDDNGKAQYKKLWSLKYPNSIGMFYSALTHRLGLKPNEEEYIMMGMSAYGNSASVNQMRYDFVSDESLLKFNQNLHIGIDENYLAEHWTEFDIAAGAQRLLEQMVMRVMTIAKALDDSDNLVYAGGVALNCLCNRLLGIYYKNIWIPPNPADAGSALGAAALKYGKKLNWQNAYLGYNIEGEYPIIPLLDHLLEHQIAGVASGRAEWGPRALGNRSLLADPRGEDIKDRVNEIKQRQQFRPFAPVILEEHLDNYFTMPDGWENSRYMQVTATCKYPKLFPAIIHVDGTSRVQTVPDDGSGIREVLERWFVLTGCPMLLNTSLNIKGEPMVNDLGDARRFELKYGVKVFS